MATPGIRLQLLVGPQRPRPAPPELLDALAAVEVTSSDRQRDGFSLTFGLEKAPTGEYALLAAGLFQPKSRVQVAVFIGAQKHVLIHGVVAEAQVQPGDRAGSARLTVVGEDDSLLMDLDHRRRPHPEQADWQIVSRILDDYRLAASIPPSARRRPDVPLRNGRQPSQNGTDLAYVRELARLNGYVFSVEPDLDPDRPAGYWGPPARQGARQAPLSADLGPATNVERLAVTFNAFAPVRSLVRRLDPESRRVEQISQPEDPLTPLSRQPARPLRTTFAPNTAKLSGPRATTRMDAEILGNAEGVTVSGELDTVRYGAVLRARRLVGLRGVGHSYDGDYYVRRVTHTLQRGSYRQRFELAREGLEAKSKVLKS